MAERKLSISQKKEWAKTLFTKERLQQNEAAKTVGVSLQTMNKWVNENDGEWKKLQRNLFLTREEQLAQMLDELVQINEAIRGKPEGQRYADSKLGDVRRKLVKDIKDLETKANAPEIIHSCKKLLEFIRKVDLEKAQEFAKIVDAFIRSIL